ncbi:acyl-CoA dehydrogenase [Alkalilimnicola ehrlichii]|uniref:Acyl-CoA dehydrogenase n=1 Tax=Alkalilimnicola ehrlichii TaxID=351052 RepID=A0A3E0WWP7_9GAMM|nr:acyl-CoA dehydrogenase family protein [Alkalilimnicola ehrlichii]RFA29296.1 acyl-CoA dehydrogenase [Alkalilimnicola ehrlichii]RFA36809.1 acyl-CoA dehydrogenase [Alkalilimnicola ehrlichii]
MDLEQVLQQASVLAQDMLAPRAEAVDREARWPKAEVRQLLEAGLGGLVLPREFGGLGQGLLGLTRVCETLGGACASTSMCVGMHMVGSAVIAARPTSVQAERYLRPTAEGKHLTTLALSERGTGANFYIPQTTLARRSDHYEVNGHKAFVTNGGEADSYVVSVVSVAGDAAPGEFSCVVVPARTEGMRWSGPWQGLGMRGNSSRLLDLHGVRIPLENLLGGEGDEIWYVLEVVAPYFLAAMTGTYLGIAARAVAIAIDHLQGRYYGHTRHSLAKQDVLQHRLGGLWAKVERTRQLAYHAAAAADQGDSTALPAVLSAKAEVADCCVDVVNDVMTLTGGQSYGENSELGRLLRDARAAHVMAPTTDILRTWTGRILLGEPMLGNE